MTAAQTQLLAGVAVLAINLVWMGMRGPALWQRYLPDHAPRPSEALWATSLLGAVTLFLGLTAASAIPGGWGMPFHEVFGGPATTVTGDEAGTGAAALFQARTAGAVLPVGVSIVTLGWLAILIDLRTRRLPDALTALMAIEVVSSAVAAPLAVPVADGWYWALAASACIWVLPVAIGNRLGQVGLGDVKVAAVLGVALGTCSFGLAALGLMAAYVAAGVHASVRLSTAKDHSVGTRRFAFGPYLLGAAIGTWGLLVVGTALTVQR